MKKVTCEVMDRTNMKTNTSVVIHFFISTVLGYRQHNAEQHENSCCFFLLLLNSLALTNRNQKIYSMKKATFILSTVFGSISILAILFKVMHWPGAGIGLVFGVSGFALIALPLLAIHRYRKA